MLADSAYSHPSTRAAPRRRGIKITSPGRRDQFAHRQRKGSHGPATRLQQDLYAVGKVVER